MADKVLTLDEQTPQEYPYAIDVVTRNIDGEDRNLLYQVKRRDQDGEPDDTKPIVSFFPFSEPKSEGGIDKHIFSAWSGARTSRTRKSYEEIFDEVLELVKMDPAAAAEKIKEFGLNYGHQSILGMIPVFLFFNNIPLEQAYWIFNRLWYGDGQESSSRYVKFSRMNFPKIEDFLDLSVIPQEAREDLEHIQQEWVDILQLAENNYKKWYELIEEGYKAQFEEGDSPIEDSTLKARILDVVRSWIPMGATTSMCLLGNLRIWNNYIKILQETGEEEYIELAKQIKAALSLSNTEEGKDVNANLEPLIKHTEPTFRIRENIAELKTAIIEMPGFIDLLEGTKMGPAYYVRETQVSVIDKTSVGVLTIMQYILVAYPRLTEEIVLEWLSCLDANQIRALSMIVFKGHTRHEKMGNLGDIRGDRIFVLNTAIAQLRDLNRHRTFGRQDIAFLSQIDYAQDGHVDYEAMISEGFNMSSKIVETTGLQHLKTEWAADANIYYTRVMDFYNYLKQRFPNTDLHLIRKLLPLGHNTRMHLSASPAHLDYFLDQRSTPGNDQSNADIVAKMIDTLETDPSLAGLYAQIAEFDYNDPVAFRDRT